MRKTLAIAAVLAAIALCVFYPPARFVALKLTGRAPDCPWSRTMDLWNQQQAQRRYHAEFVRASKVIQTDPAGYELMDTPRGRWWIPTGNEFVLPFNLAEQEREVYGTGDRAVHPGDVVIDGGANVGTFTRTALRRGASLVIGFEPAPENIEVYRRNFQNEIAAGTVILIPKGLWNKEDVLMLKRDPHNNAADSFLLLKDGTNAVAAPLTAIDHALAGMKLDRVDYIKLDIEGAEVQALEGARETLRRFHPRMSIAAEHYAADALRIPRALRSIAPDYRAACGPCLEDQNGRVRPDVLYFR